MRLREGVLAGIVVAALSCVSATAQELPPPDERVAQVGAVAISRTDFDHWFASASHSQFGRPMELVSPGYERCTAAKRKLRAAKGWRKLSERELRSRCARDHRDVRRQVMQFLVQGQWVEQEAATRGVAVSERRVEQIFEKQKRAAFSNERGYQRFLRESGATETDILYRIRLDTLQNRLTRHVTRSPSSGSSRVSASAIARRRGAPRAM
ncbi:MAG TPA: SurA N-terminal domain-containing protein [Thermoleophilaceae bacterium]|nr:SurA N-terminal domain-containing protein [Thermoleophilaceae bacterium]